MGAKIFCHADPIRILTRRVQIGIGIHIKITFGIDVHYELNALDQIVSEGNKDISTLKNDICGNDELLFNVKSPTPVTTCCIRHSNKHGRKIKYENLKILLD